MIVFSDNEAANELEVWLAGSTSAGSSRVNETMRSLGLTDSEMYGGYETRRPSAGAPIPIRVESQPDFGVGKYTTAADLARLARAVYLGGVGKGPLLRLGVSASEARYLLWLLSQASDRGKLDRFIGSGIGSEPVVMHKAGWLTSARHDNGVVAFWSGAYVATVLTWQTARADELAGRSDLARLARAVYLAGVGKGPLPRLGVSASEARYLLWLLSQASDHGTFDRFIGPGPVVMHKAGWLSTARHDNGIVAYLGGAYVATVMTWKTPLADELAGAVAFRALTIFTQ